MSCNVVDYREAQSILRGKINSFELRLIAFLRSRYGKFAYVNSLCHFTVFLKSYIHS